VKSQIWIPCASRHASSANGAGRGTREGGHLRWGCDRRTVHERGLRIFRAARIDTPHTHGTGCTFSAAVTAGLARGTALAEAVAQAKEFITAAIRTNPGLGHGSGPSIITLAVPPEEPS